MADVIKYVAVLLTVIQFQMSYAVDSNQATKSNQIGSSGKRPQTRTFAANANTTSPPEHNPGSEILQNTLKFLTAQPFNDFDWKLSKLFDQIERSNFVISPISVKLALGMLYLGVEGTAAKEISDAFNINSSMKDTVIEKFSHTLKSLQESQNNEYELNIGTKLFLDKSAKVEDEFQKNLLSYYNSSIKTVDFKQTAAAINVVNEWCSAMTKGKIKQLIDKDDTQDGTIMMLLNAIYFRGEWEIPFPEKNTKNDAFWISGAKQVLVPTMSVADKFWYYNATEIKSHLIRLPYAGKKYAMYLIVPHDVDGLFSLGKIINAPLLAKGLKQMTEYNLNLRLPKFQFQSTAQLVPVLKKLGINELFSPSANLNKIGVSPNGPLMVSNMLQKSGIEVNEKGSEAHAATEVQIIFKLGDSEATDLNVNHPFVFLIADEVNDAIIFTGKVVNPATATGVEPITQEPVAGVDEIGNRIKPSEGEDTGAHANDVINDRYNYFDKELLEEVADLVQGNVLLSPASVKSSLALCLEGARGKTEAEIRYALRLPDDKNESSVILQQQQKTLKLKSSTVTLESQNKVFIAQNEKLLPIYQQTIKDNYNSEIKRVNFANSEVAAKTINDWVNNVTEGLIPTLVKKDDFDASTKLFLANCIYFKGDWESEFDAKQTRVECFYNSEKCINTQFMRSERVAKFLSAKHLNAKVVELPFKDPRFSMVFMLPHKKDGVYNLMKDLQHQNLAELFLNLRKQTVQLSIPKFTIEFSVSLSKALQLLKINDLFTLNANLSGLLDGNSPVSVKEIIHKAKIEINEKGAKAAAATGVQVVLLSAPVVYEFKANSPFLFFIRDTATPGFLFEGLLINPTQSETVAVPTVQPISAFSNRQKPNARRPTTTTRTKNIYQFSHGHDEESVNYPLRPNNY